MSRQAVTILTFHFNQNYGAVIQAYALQNFLEKNGYDSIFPGYIPSYMVPSSGLFRGIKSNGKIQPQLILQKLQSIPRRLKFHRFRKQHLKIDTRAASLEKSLVLQQTSAAVIVGSDQVWNLNWHPADSFDGYYFMESFGRDHHLRNRPKLISYAACFGKKDQPPAKLAKAAALIAKFDAVFSRNQLTREITERAAGIEVPLVVDPTLLPGVLWPIRTNGRNRGRYILLYSIDEQQAPMASKILSRLRAITDLPVIQVCSENAHLVEGCQHYEKAASPAEWLELIHHAECVVTDSFHGCVFSLKFGRKFIAYAPDWRAERIQDLLERVGLERLLLTSDSLLDRIELPGFLDLNQISIQEKLGKLGGESSTHLLAALPCKI